MPDANTLAATARAHHMLSSINDARAALAAIVGMPAPEPLRWTEADIDELVTMISAKEAT